LNFRRCCAVARKEFLHILRDVRSLIAALAIPVFLLWLFGYALTLDVDRIPIHVYDQDRTPHSREVIERFRGSRYFTVQDSVQDYKAVERAIDRNRILLGVAIPRGFGGALEAGETAAVQLLLDGSDSNTASIALSYAEAMLQTYAMEVRLAALRRMGVTRTQPPVEGRLRVWYNEELKSRNYIVPGLIAVILMILSALMTSLTIAREWENGTMEQLLSTPVRPTELLLGKLSAYFAVGMADVAITLVVGVFGFHVPLRGNVLLLVATSCIFLIGALCWGIFLSAVTRSQLLAYQLSVITSFLPAFLLSGFIFSIENMPRLIQAVTYLVPARYFVAFLNGVFLKGVGWEILWAEVSLLAVYTLALFLLASRKMRQKVA
jgi:ABC-2 type transport system permease protein